LLLASFECTGTGVDIDGGVVIPVFNKTKMNSFIIYSMISLSYGQILNRADWPEAFKVPPTFESWTNRALKDVNIPDSPLRPPFSGPYITSSSDLIGCNDQNTWAFSYDDGPGPYTVDFALKPLKDRNIKGTFYVTGQEVALYPEILKQIYDDGHSIGIHTWSHKPLSSLTHAEIVAELVWTSSIIKQVIGVVPSHVRPPFMDLDDRSRAVVHALGFKISLWNFDTNDWQYEGYTPDSKSVPDPAIAVPQAVRNRISQPRVGTISLQHDLFMYSAQQIAPALDIVRNTSYRFATVPECAAFPGYGNPLIDEILALPRTETPTTTPNGTTKLQDQKNRGSNLQVSYLLPLLILLLI